MNSQNDLGWVHLLIVTPMHDEEANVAGVHRGLMEQTGVRFDWVVVNDGSEDDTSVLLKALGETPVPRVFHRQNGGGLIGGSAYSAWRFGIKSALVSGVSYTHVMKLDADVRLPPGYLHTVLAGVSPSAGVMGGVIADRGKREQIYHVPGPVKIYTWDAYAQLEHLPSAIGFDVMDEVAVEMAGLSTQVISSARFSLSRAIGASEGGFHGRYRNGRVCRWTGYNPIYFGIHVIRYVFRAPYVIGAIGMVIGYANAGGGPYPATLKKRHGQMQVRKLRDAARNPFRWVFQTYRY